VRAQYLHASSLDLAEETRSGRNVRRKEVARVFETGTLNRQIRAGGTQSKLGAAPCQVSGGPEAIVLCRRDEVILQDGLEIAGGPALTRTGVAVGTRNTCSKTIDPALKTLSQRHETPGHWSAGSKLSRVQFQEAILTEATSRHGH